MERENNRVYFSVLLSIMPFMQRSEIRLKLYGQNQISRVVFLESILEILNLACIALHSAY